MTFTTTLEPRLTWALLRWSGSTRSSNACFTVYTWENSSTTGTRSWEVRASFRVMLAEAMPVEYITWKSLSRMSS